MNRRGRGVKDVKVVKVPSVYAKLLEHPYAGYLLLVLVAILVIVVVDLLSKRFTRVKTKEDAKPPAKTPAVRTSPTNAKKSPSAKTPVVVKKLSLEQFLLRLKDKGYVVLKVKPTGQRKEKVLRIDDKAVLYFEPTGLSWITGKDKKSAWSALQLKAVVDGDSKKLEFFVEFHEKVGVSILHLAASNAEDLKELTEGLALLLTQIETHPQHVTQLLSAGVRGAIASPSPAKGTKPSASSTATTPLPIASAVVTPSSSSNGTGKTSPTRKAQLFSFFSPSKRAKQAEPQPGAPKPAEPLASLSISSLKDLVSKNGLTDQAVGFIEKKEYVVLLETYYLQFGETQTAAN